MPKPDIGQKSWFLPHLGGPHRNIAITFAVDKLEWCGYPMVKKIVKIRLFVLTEYKNMTDTWMDTT